VQERRLARELEAVRTRHRVAFEHRDGRLELPRRMMDVVRK